jgi:hypothetical protein
VEAAGVEVHTCVPVGAAAPIFTERGAATEDRRAPVRPGLLCGETVNQRVNGFWLILRATVPYKRSRWQRIIDEGGAAAVLSIPKHRPERFPPVAHGSTLSIQPCIACSATI